MKSSIKTCDGNELVLVIPVDLVSSFADRFEVRISDLNIAQLEIVCRVLCEERMLRLARASRNRK